MCFPLATCLPKGGVGCPPLMIVISSAHDHMVPGALPGNQAAYGGLRGPTRLF